MLFVLLVSLSIATFHSDKQYGRTMERKMPNCTKYDAEPQNAPIVNLSLPHVPWPRVKENSTSLGVMTWS